MGDGGGGDDDGGGRIFPEHPSPILHAPRDIISRKGKSLTPTNSYNICKAPNEGIAVRDCYRVYVIMITS